MDYVVWTVISALLILSVLGIIVSIALSTTSVAMLEVDVHKIGSVLVLEIRNVGTVKTKILDVVLVSNSGQLAERCIPVTKVNNTVLLPGQKTELLFSGAGCEDVSKVHIVTDRGLYTAYTS